MGNFWKKWKWPSNPGAQKWDSEQTGIMECQQERWKCSMVVFSGQCQGEAVMLEMQEEQEKLQALCKQLTILSCWHSQKANLVSEQHRELCVVPALPKEDDHLGLCMQWKLPRQWKSWCLLNRQFPRLKTDAPNINLATICVDIRGFVCQQEQVWLAGWLGKGSLQQEGTGGTVRSQRCPCATALHSSKSRDGSMWQHSASSLGSGTQSRVFSPCAADWS